MTTVSNTCGKDDFHRERSRFIDAFAALEEAMHGKPPIPTDKQAADLLKSLRAIRNDLVHSQLRFAPLDGKLHAIIINAQDVNKTARASRVIALEDFTKLASHIAEIKRSVC